jgi:hypothetical protein
MPDRLTTPHWQRNIFCLIFCTGDIEQRELNPIRKKSLNLYWVQLFFMEKVIEKNGKYYLTGTNEKKSWWFRISKKRWLNDWHELTPTQRTLMLSLWLYAGKRNTCYPSQRKLGQDLHVDTATINRNIKILKRKKYLDFVKEKGRWNHYLLLK